MPCSYCNDSHSAFDPCPESIVAMRDSEHDANLYLTPLPESLRRAGAVIDAGCKQRWTALERAERRRECGARAVGMLTALLRMGELAECYREQAREIVREWER